MRENIYYQRNRETILNRVKSIIKTMKKDWERAKNKNRELSEEEKNRNRYRNISEENKERIKEYQKNIAELIKADSLNLTKNA